MGYLKIPNLRNVPDLLDLLGQVFALEKIHGSSSHVSWEGRDLHFFAGGQKHATFTRIFDQPALATSFQALGHGDTKITVYGEVYGGKCQGMSRTYGPSLSFVAFDVQIGEFWLDVPAAHEVTNKLGLEFVHYERGPCTVEWLTQQREAPSVQAQRKGIAEPRQREGIVIRPLTELIRKNGDRVIAKYRNHAFEERAKPPREIDPAKAERIEGARRVAEEFVVPMRLEHVLDKIRAERDGSDPEIKDTGMVVKRMIEDVRTEESQNVAEWTLETDKEIGRAAAKLFHAWLKREAPPGLD